MVPDLVAKHRDLKMEMQETGNENGFQVSDRRQNSECKKQRDRVLINDTKTTKVQSWCRGMTLCDRLR